MKFSSRYLWIILSMVVFSRCADNPKTDIVDLKWDTINALPPVGEQLHQPGLAGAITGISNGQLLVAGGSNFPDRPPWQGGTKTYYSEIFMYALNGPGQWQIHGEALPIPMAYAGTCVVDDRIIVVGGEGPNGVLNKAMSIEISDSTLNIASLLQYPVGVSNPGVAAIGKTIYAVGGLVNGAATNLFSYSRSEQVNPGMETTARPSGCLIACCNGQPV